jgi:hypothetical protein
MFIEEMPTVLAPYIDANEPVQVASSPGAGKSENMDQIVAFNSERDGFEWGLCKVFAAALSPVDFYGFLTPGVRHWHDFEGKERITKVSEFTEPPFMISMDGRPMNSFKRGIVVFEEWDKAEADTKKASAEPILNGGNGAHRLHKGISRVVLVNRQEDRSGSTKNFDFIINRRGELTAYTSMPGWIKWASRNDIDPMFTSFAERYPEVVFTNKVPDIQGPFVTPRSLVKCQNVVKQRRDETREIIVDDTAGEIITGWLGNTATAQLMAWLKMKTETPAWDDIVRRPEQVEVPERADACLMSCHECAHRVDSKTIRPTITYMRRLPKEFAMSFARAAIQRMPRLVADRDMMAWSKENRSLLNILGGASV